MKTTNAEIDSIVRPADLVLKDFNINQDTESIALKKGKKLPSAIETLGAVQAKSFDSKFSRIVGAQLIRLAESMDALAYGDLLQLADSETLPKECHDPLVKLADTVKKSGVISAKQAIREALDIAAKSDKDIAYMLDMLPALAEKDRLVAAEQCDPRVPVSTILVVLKATQTALTADKDGKLTLAVAEMAPIFDKLKANEAPSLAIRPLLDKCKIEANVAAIKRKEAPVFRFNKGSDGDKANNRAVCLAKVEKGIHPSIEEVNALASTLTKEDVDKASKVAEDKRSKFQTWTLENGPKPEVEKASDDKASETTEDKGGEDKGGDKGAEAPKPKDLSEWFRFVMTSCEQIALAHGSLIEKGATPAAMPNEAENAIVELLKLARPGFALRLHWDAPQQTEKQTPHVEKASEKEVTDLISKRERKPAAK